MAKAETMVPPPPAGQRNEDFGFDLEVPGIVGLVELKNGSRRNGRVASPFQDDLTEIRKTGLDAAVERIEPVEDGAVGAEIGHDVWTCADRPQVCIGTFARRPAQTGGERRGLEDRAQVGHKRGIGKRRRSIERDGDGPLVDGINGSHILEARRLGAATAGCGAVSPRKNNVVRAERRAVGPDHTLPDGQQMLPRDIGRRVRLSAEIEQDFGFRFLQTQPSGL